MTLALAAVSLASLASLLGLGLQAVRGRADEKTSRLLSAALVVFACVVANAAACGGLSGVYGRYEARVLAPLIILGGFALALILRSRRIEP